MTQTVGDLIVERPRHWGARRISSHPGEGINGAIRQMLGNVPPDRRG
jgi:hypothetical protein